MTQLQGLNIAKETDVQVNSKEQAMSLIRQVAWACAEDSSLRKSLSYMGFIYLTQAEMKGACAGKRLASHVVQAKQALIHRGDQEQTVWYARVGQDKGNRLHAQRARANISQEMAGTPGDEKAGGLH